MEQIRELTFDYIDEILKLENQLFQQPYSREDYQYLLTSDPLSYAAMIIDNEVIKAYGVIQMVYETATLITIGVGVEYQGMGYGKRLLAHLIEQAKQKGCTQMILEVRVSNVPAINLYQSFDFKKNRLRPYYYGNEDGIEMIKDWSEDHAR